MESALALLQTVRAENGEVSGGTWNAVISSCARARPAWEEALRILELVPPEQAGVKHFTSALAACNSAFGQEPQWEAALWLMDEMGARGVQADQYAVAGCLSTLGAAGHADEAVELLETCGVEPDLAMMNAAMLACARAGRPSASRRSPTAHRRRPHPKPAHAPRARALATARRPAAAPMRLLERLRLRGEALPRSTFHALMRACTDDGRGADALELWWAASRRTAVGRDAGGGARRCALAVVVVARGDGSSASFSSEGARKSTAPTARASAVYRVPDGTPALVSTRSFEAILERCVRGAREAASGAAPRLWSSPSPSFGRSSSRRSCAHSPSAPASRRPPARQRGAGRVGLGCSSCSRARGQSPPPPPPRRARAVVAARPRQGVRGRDRGLQASGAGSWETALGLLREMGARQRAAPPPSAYVAALRVVAADSRWLLAISLRDELRAAHGEAPDDALNLVAQACEAAGAWTAALQAQQERPREARVATKVRALRFLSELEKAEATRGGEGGAGGEAGGGRRSARWMAPRRACAPSPRRCARRRSLRAARAPRACARRRRRFGGRALKSIRWRRRGR